MSFPLFLALKYLKPKRSMASVVTILAIIGVLKGVAILIVARAIMTGFGIVWHEKILAFKPHITLSASAQFTGSRILSDEDGLTKKIGAIPGVIAASPAIETRVLAEYRQNILAPIVIGLAPATATNMVPFKTDEFRGEFDLEGDSVLVGAAFADLLGIRVGSKILVYSPLNIINKDEIYFPEELLVTGIFETGQTTQFDSDFILVSLPLARDLVGLEDGVYSLHIKTENPRDEKQFDQVCTRIFNAVGYVEYNLETWREVDRELFNALAVEKNLVSLLLGVITIVAIFCVTITLIVTTVQKTHEIGLLKALGFPAWKILLTFVFYSLIQCVIGMALGIATAFLILCNLKPILEFLRRFDIEAFPAGVYGLDKLPWSITAYEIFMIILLVLICCTAFATLFAWLAARLDPVTALRKE